LNDYIGIPGLELEIEGVNSLPSLRYNFAARELDGKESADI
jgi:hypothetical protein